VAASIIASHVISGGLPAGSGFEIAFLMSAGVALAAGAFGLLIPGRAKAGLVPLGVPRSVASEANANGTRRS
jgi:hypothetical protein